MRPWWLVFSLVFLVACAPQAAERGRRTDVSATFIPTPTETPPPTPTPEKISLAGTFGLAPEVATKFAGAERYIRRAENGAYLVTAFYRDPQTGKLKSIDLALLPDTFATHDDLRAHNPLAPYTVRAISPRLWLFEQSCARERWGRG